MKILGLVTWCIALASAISIQGQCQPFAQGHPNHERARIIIQSSAASLLGRPTIQAGFEAWNHAICVNRYLRPFPFPEFFEGSSGDPSITFAAEEGPTPSGSACAEFEGDTAGGSARITLYRKIRGSGTGEVYNCDWSSPEKATNVVAHELGHYLTLSHVGAGCSGMIMDRQHTLYSDGTAWDITPDREITFEECKVADRSSETPWEQEEANCELDPSCNPDTPCGPTCCPILVDLDRNFFELSGGRVLFDIDANGIDDPLTWTSGHTLDAFLALDRNGNGLIDDGSELFGNGTLLSNGFRAVHGYMALADLDTRLMGGNGDGWIDSQDRLFPHLLLWVDADQDAVADRGEVRRAEVLGLVEIELGFFYTGIEDEHGNELRYAAPARFRNAWGELELVWTVDAFFRRLVGDAEP